MAKKAISLLLCLIMVFTLSLGCMTGASALDLSDVTGKLPIITGQPQDAEIEGTGTATFTVTTVFDQLLTMIQSNDFDLEAWLESMLQQGMSPEDILKVLQEMGLSWSDIVEALQGAGVDLDTIIAALQGQGLDLETILKALQGGGFDIQTIIGQLMQNPSIDTATLLALLQQLMGGATTMSAEDETPVTPSLPEIDVETLLAALKQAMGDALTDETVQKLQALLAQLGDEIDVTDVIEAVKAALGDDFDLAAVIEAVKAALGDDFDLAAVIEAVKAALGDDFDLAAVIEAVKAALGDDFDLAAVIEAVKAALGDDFDLETVIKALIDALGDQLDLQALIDALKAALGDQFDLEALIKALIGSGVDWNELLAKLKELGYSAEEIYNLLIGKYLSYAWYVRADALAVAVAAATDPNSYSGDTTKTLTVTRAVSPTQTEQYTYFCTVTVLGAAVNSDDAVLTIRVKGSTPALNRETHIAYINGYPDGTVCPNSNITRAETAKIFYTLLTDDSRAYYHATSCAFTDVPDGKWYTESIATLTRAGILKGYKDGSFHPNEPITRAEMATVIARFAQLSESSVTFSDIQGHWAQDEIELAASNGWIEGYPDGTFQPNQNITRAETITMVNRALDRDELTLASLLPGMKTFSDNSVGAWYYLAIQEAANAHEYARGDSGAEFWTALTA